MANHALVVGCDGYWDEASTLHGAVRDALAVRSWLLDPAGGDVPAQNLALLLTPAEHSELPARLASSPPATRAAIVQAVDALLRRSRDDEGVLYFYFAGHGLTGSAAGNDEPCLLPADFLPRYRDPALPVRDLMEHFATASLVRQFLFVDACRGVPVTGTLLARGISDRPPRDYDRPEPDQYAYFATSAGQAAYEWNSTGGQFTAALLRGLRGTGAAKRWDPYHERYVLRARELFDFVRSELAAAGVRQLPRALESYSEPNPVLATFPEDSFAPVTLTVSVTPQEAAPHTTIGAFGPADHVSRPRGDAPVRLRLAPRTYSVRAHAPRFRPRALTVDLYADTELGIGLEPGDSGPEPTWLTPRPRGGIAGGGFERCSPADAVTVPAAAPGAVLEVRDESGAVRFVGGAATLDRPGRYELRIVRPHGAGPVIRVQVPAPGGVSRTEPAEPPAESPARPHARVDRLTVLTAGGERHLPLAAGPAVVEVGCGLRIAVFGPAVVVADLSDAVAPIVTHRPVGDAATAARADAAQRFVAQGRAAQAQAVLDSGPAGWPGTVLQGLLAARRGGAGRTEVRRAAATLTREAPGLPDAAVLRAIAETRGGRARAPELRSPPVLTAALTAAIGLYRAVAAEPPADLAAAWAGLVPGQPGTAWRGAG